MKLGILSESPADEAAIKELAEAVVAESVEVTQPSLRARGWPSVVQVLPAVLRHLHFNTDVAGLVVVVDTDDSVVHVASHDAPGYFHPQCRLCHLRAVFRQTTKKLPPAHGRKHVLRGIGVAVPAIEAWYLCGREDGVTEEQWRIALAEETRPFTRAQLKSRVYGTDRPNLPEETRCALAQIGRLKCDLRRLENDFPGFEALAKDLRSWREVKG